jgi:hypothetical protein
MSRNPQHVLFFHSLILDKYGRRLHQSTEFASAIFGHQFLFPSRHDERTVFIVVLLSDHFVVGWRCWAWEPWNHTGPLFRSSQG